MPITFIGDVHGQLSALEAILPQCEGHILFMGDLIDRGMRSKQTMQLVRELCASGKASCILGNHEFALLSSLGMPHLGIEAKPDFFAAWCQVYGGMNTLISYGVGDIDMGAIRELLRVDLEWIAQLPWFLRGSVDGRDYIAVHAGFNKHEPLALQLAALADTAAWWSSVEQLPPALYEHKRAKHNPPDLPANICVVSGHTVQAEVQISPQRVLCDTSGGRPDRLLSGVIWPSGRVIAAPTE